jgi:hypothetical protein
MITVAVVIKITETSHCESTKQATSCKLLQNKNYHLKSRE